MINTISKKKTNIEIELKIKSDLQYLSIVRAFFKSVVEPFEAPNDKIFEIMLVLDEALANIIEHGYKLEKEHEIIIGLDVTFKRIVISITDFSAGFDISKFGNVNLEEHKKKRKNRGLGVFIIKKIMDEVEYTHNPYNGNKLVLTKHLQQE